MVKKKDLRGKFPDFFVQAFKNCRRFLIIQYVIAIHLMR